jgi:hypothetical protein
MQEEYILTCTSAEIISYSELGLSVTEVTAAPTGALVSDYRPHQSKNNVHSLSKQSKPSLIWLQLIQNKIQKILFTVEYTL